MRIVLVVDYFQPKLGYQEFFLAKEMKKLGHEVFVVTSNYFFPFPDYQRTVYKILGKRKRKVGIFTEEGVKVYRLPILFQTRNGGVTILRNLRQTLAKLKPGIVFSDGVFTPLALQTAFYKTRIGYKLFYDSHASTFNTKLRDTLIKRIYMFFFSRFFIPYIKRQANGYTAVGESEKFLLCQEYQLPKTSVKLIPLAADTDKFTPAKNTNQETRGGLGLKNNDFVIIYAGKITANKDLDTLLKALPLLVPGHDRLKLLILGDGDESLLQKLHSLIREKKLDDKVIWRSMVKNSLLPSFFNAANIGIWPGNPSNTILEAMACGLPLILPKVISEAQTSDHLLNNKNGLSFTRGDASDLKEKIEHLMNNPGLLPSMSQGSRTLALREFSWQKRAKDYLRLVKQRN